jgi:hypothetical protein
MVDELVLLPFRTTGEYPDRAERAEMVNFGAKELGLFPSINYWCLDPRCLGTAREPADCGGCRRRMDMDVI